jgi:hypothetical protein
MSTGFELVSGAADALMLAPHKNAPAISVDAK